MLSKRKKLLRFFLLETFLYKYFPSLSCVCIHILNTGSVTQWSSKNFNFNLHGNFFCSQTPFKRVRNEWESFCLKFKWKYFLQFNSLNFSSNLQKFIKVGNFQKTISWANLRRGGGDENIRKIERIFIKSECFHHYPMFSAIIDDSFL